MLSLKDELNHIKGKKEVSQTDKAVNMEDLRKKGVQKTGPVWMEHRTRGEYQEGDGRGRQEPHNLRPHIVGKDLVFYTNTFYY